MIPILRTGRETRPLRAQEFNLVQPWGQEAPLYLYRGIFPPDNISLFSNYIFRAWCKFPFFFCEERRRQKRLLRMRMAHNNENALSATSADNCKKAQWKKRKREERATTENWRKRRDTPRALTRDRTHHLAPFFTLSRSLIEFHGPNLFGFIPLPRAFPRWLSLRLYIQYITILFFTRYFLYIQSSILSYKNANRSLIAGSN